MIACGSPAQRTVGTRAGLWNIEHSKPNGQLAKASGAIGQFDFPQSNGWIGYVVSDYVGPRPSAIFIHFSIYGDGQFDANWTGTNGPAQGCTLPPSAVLMVQVVGDDLSDQDGRWWSGSQSLYNNLEISINEPVDPANWTNVEGKSGSDRPEEFEKAMKNLGHVGITFGGGCNYGHGVNLSSGSSTFTLISYEVK